MSDTKPVIIGSVILCDDIRKEDTGKGILIGVYSGNITVFRFPTAASLSVWIEHDVTEIGKFEFHCRLLLDDEIEVVSIAGELDAKELGPGDFAFGGISTQLQREGYLSIQFKIADQEWTEIRRKRIIKSENLLETGVPQIN